MVVRLIEWDFTMRRCPRCQFRLSQHKVRGIEVDHCHHCAGTFFDPGETEGVLSNFAKPELWLKSSICRPLGETPLESPDFSGNLSAFRLELPEPVTVFRSRETGGIWLDAKDAAAFQQQVVKESQRTDSPLAEHHKEFGAGKYILQLLTELPLEVWHPTRRFPTVTLTYIILCVLVFVAQIVDGLDEDSGLIQMFALQHELFSGSSPIGLFTYMFLHGGLMHIVGNMLMLWVLGDNTECELGPAAYIGLCVGSSVVGGLAQVLISDATGPIVGASGAIAGIMGAYCVLFPKIRIRLVFLFFPIYMPAFVFVFVWGGLNLLMAGIGGAGVAWWAHLGGLMTGVLIAWPLRRKPFEEVMAAKAKQRYQR